MQEYYRVLNEEAQGVITMAKASELIHEITKYLDDKIRNQYDCDNSYVALTVLKDIDTNFYQIWALLYGFLSNVPTHNIESEDNALYSSGNTLISALKKYYKLVKETDQFVLNIIKPEEILLKKSSKKPLPR